MTNEIAVPAARITGSALVIDAEQNYWSDRQLAVLKTLGVKDATPPDLAVFFHQALRTGLDPFARQIYMIGRKDRDAPNGVKQTIQTGIDGFRLIARRAADKAGDTLGYEDPAWCGQDGVWRDVWASDEHPFAARVRVLRAGQPFPGVAHWSEFVQTKFGGETNAMWSRMGRNQIAKCAEAQALRRAFPHDLSGIYTDDEMHAQDNERRRVRPTASVTSADILNVDAEPEPVQDVTGNVELIRPAQMKRLHALCTEKGFKDRDDKLDFIRGVIGVGVESTKDLTTDQASLAIDALDKLDA